MTNLVMAVGCLVAAVCLLDRAPRLAGWLVVGAGLYGYLLYGSVG
jgi:hypothetical protein